MQEISLIIGADHLGLPLKNTIKEHLLKNNYKIDDLGVNTDDMVDYPDIGEKLAKKLPQPLAIEESCFVVQGQVWP